MFKWVCLLVVTAFLAGVGWLLNDVRLEIRKSSQMVQDTGLTVNEQLPSIVEKIQTTMDGIADRLPEIVDDTGKATAALAELAADIRQLKELTGMAHTARDKNLVAYADSVLDEIEAADGVIGLKKSFGGRGLKNPLPTQEWTAAARKEALFLTVVAKSKKELLTRLVANKFSSPWFIQLNGEEPVNLLDWLKVHHDATRNL